MKKIKLFKLLLILLSLSFFILNILFIKNVIKIKANDVEVKLILKLQGDYSRYNKNPILTKITLYNPYQKIIDFENIYLTQEKNNIFSTNIKLNNIDLNQIYSIFIKPNKYLGKLVKNQIFKTTDINIIDISNEYFFSGDLDPVDGKITAYELSLIIRDLGNINKPQTDINSDGITDTQDYSLLLYSLKENVTEDEIILLPTPTPTITTTSIPSMTPTPTPTTTVIINQTTNSSSSLNVDPYCKIMEKELPNSSMIYPNSSTKTPETTNKICAWNKGKYYSLPYRNPNCTVTQEMIDRAYERMKTFYPKYYQQSKLKEQWQIVQDLAIKYNFNPLFVISLWIEESAAGGATQAQQLGCLYRRNKNGTFTFLGPESNICQQMECLFGSTAVIPDNFARWACPYQHGYQNWNNNDCLKVTTFTRIIDFWYNYMSDQGKLLKQGCQIEYSSPSDYRCP